MAFIRWRVAVGPRAHWIFRHRHLPLLPRSPAPRLVKVYGSGDGMDEGDKADVGKRTAGKVRTGNLRAIGQLQRHVLAVGDLDHLIEGEDHVGGDCGSGGTLGKDAASIGDGGDMVINLCHQFGLGGNGQRPQVIAAAG